MIQSCFWCYTHAYLQFITSEALKDELRKSEISAVTSEWLQMVVVVIRMTYWYSLQLSRPYDLLIFRFVIWMTRVPSYVIDPDDTLHVPFSTSMTIEILGPFHSHRLTFILAWISNARLSVSWNYIYICKLQKLHRWSLLMDKLVPHFIMNLITIPGWDLS